MARKNSDNENKKSLVPSLVAMGVSVGGWLYGISQNIFSTFKSIFSNITGSGTNLNNSETFETGSKLDSPDTVAMLLIVAAMLIVTVIGVIGLISFFKRLFGRFAKPEGKENEAKKAEPETVKKDEVVTDAIVAAETVAVKDDEKSE